MKQPFFFLIIAGTLSACPSPSEKNTGTEAARDSVQEEEAVSETESLRCYAYINNNDTIWMHLNTEGETVNGKLAYKFFEKDKSQGTLEGEMQGDTLFANYRFMSEGMTSEREVAFLKQGDTFVEGYGDVEEQNGRMVLKNKGSLNFNSNTVLRKVACDE